MKTYDIFKLLTEEQVKTMLAARYYLVRDGGSLKTGNYCCPLGMALGPSVRPRPTPDLIAATLAPEHPEYTRDQIVAMAIEYVDDNDSGEVHPDDLPEIVRLSRLDSES